MQHKIIICGSSRAGKTTLAKLAHKHSESHKGLIFEGLFPAYFSRLSYVIPQKHKALFREYMQRPRFVDEGKSKTLTPSDQLEFTSEDIEKKFKNNLPTALGNSFGENWIIADLHAELYYKKLINAWPDVHFCIPIRDPRDCVCAGLYWQDYPNAKSNRKQHFYKCLFSWMLSAHMAHQIEKKHPNQITILNFNQIKNQEIAENVFGLKDGWRDDLPEHTYYSFTSDKKFTTPKEGERANLLTPHERTIIQSLCADIMHKYDYPVENELPPVKHRWILHAIKSTILGMTYLSPSLARGMIDLLFSPKQHAKNQINRLKQLIKDIKNF